MEDLDGLWGHDWSDAENDLIVADYLDMLRLELAGKPYVKSQRNAALRQLVRRSQGSIEFKHQNISAVLERLGLPWIQGYKPRHNSQTTLINAIDRHYHLFNMVGEQGATAQSEFNENAAIIFTAPPAKLERAEGIQNNALSRIVRKFDPAERDFKNRELGKRGEAAILLRERSRLSMVDEKLANKVRWVSQVDGDGAGYDILSFEDDGRERLIEVKTTVGGAMTPFFISRNEVDLSQEKPDAFKLVRLYDFTKCPTAFELEPPLADHVEIEPNSFVARFT